MSDKLRGEVAILIAGLVAVCVAAKAVLLPFPVTTVGEFIRWLLRLAIVVSPDVCFVAALGALFFAATWLVTCRGMGILPMRGTRAGCPCHVESAVRVLVYVTTFIATGYAVASVAIYRHTMVPLTLPSIFLMGGGEAASSIFACVSPATLACLILAPPLVALLPWIGQRVAGSPLRLTLSRRGFVGVTVLIAAYGAVCHYYVRTKWDDPNRWERRIAQSPHAVFVTSCVHELCQADTLELLGDPDDRDFTTSTEPSIWPASFVARSNRPTNIVWIVMESTSVEYLRLYGARHDTTPNLERLTRDGGVVFENVYVQSPSSCQSLAAMVASIYPRPAFGLTVRDEPDFDVPTIAEVLAEQGYRTCFAHSGYWKWKGRDHFLRSRGGQRLLDADNITGERINSWGVADQAMFQATLNWIDEGRNAGFSRSDAPFFLLAYTLETHHPYVAREPRRDFGVADENFHRYLNSLRAADELIAWFMSELGRRNLLDSTIVAVTADHGESFGQHNQTIHSFSVYEQAVHVPLILLHPRLRDTQPARVADVAQHIDIAPTLLDAVGIARPPAWQGRSLLRPEERADHRAYFFATGNQVVLGLRDGPFKYHYYLADGREELFDLAADLGETSNLAEEQADRCAAYRRKLGGFVQYQRRFLQRR